MSRVDKRRSKWLWAFLLVGSAKRANDCKADVRYGTAIHAGVTPEGHGARA